MTFDETVDAATDAVMERLSRYNLDEEDRQTVRRYVAWGYKRHIEEPLPDERPWDELIELLATQLDEGFAAEHRGETISLGPLMDHMLFAICPLWPFCGPRPEPAP